MFFGFKNYNGSRTMRNPGPGAYSHKGSFLNIPGSKIGTS